MSRHQLTPAGTPPARRRPRWRSKRAAAVVIVGLAAGTSVVVAQAAVPTFPDNIVVFPDRDFVTVEGYQDHIGETATIEVTRNGAVVGSARAVVAEGDVAFEVNHPGGVCWGNETSHQVTPDIQKGDKVSVRFADGTTGDTTVASGTATSHAVLDATDATIVRVSGTFGADVNADRVEARIVNPDLTDLIGRRDVRAAPGDVTRSDRGPYASGLTLANGTWTATFDFDDPEAARIAQSTQVERFMSWQVEDPAANRQGLTISEFGEVGGPGMGGCPAGPGEVAPPQASYTTTRSADKTKLAVNWTPAEATAGTPAVTGYSVEAIKADGTLVGARVGAEETNATLTVDPAVAEYAVEVRSMAGTKMGEPFTLAPPTSGTTTPTGDLTPPKLSADPAAGDTAETAAVTSSVTLLSETSADLYYTTDGQPVLDGDLPSQTAKLYTGPIAIREATEVHAVAIDRAGNVSNTVVGFYRPAAVDPPAALTAPVLSQPTGADVGKTSVKLSWAAVEGATGYQVTAYTDAGVALPDAQQPGETTNLSQTIGGLAGSTAYRFKVVAMNAGGRSDASNEVRAVTLEDLTIDTARWKTGDMRVGGASSAANGVVSVHRVNADGSVGARIGGRVTLTTAVAPATGTTYDWRLRTGVPTTNPGRVIVQSWDSAQSTTPRAKSDPFTVASR